MAATHIPLGDPAHEGERQGIRYLVENLPSDYTVYSNAWLVDPKGVVYELDTVVVAPHGIYVTELKCHAARVYGTDFDWTIESRPPRTERSPLRLNRITAQVLATMLRRESFEAGRRWVEHFIFLPVAPVVDVRGRASNGRVHGKSTIIAALQDARTFVERSGRSELPRVDQETRGALDRLLRGSDPSRKPLRRIREYRLEGVRDRTDRFVEYDAVYDFPGAQERRVLRVYPLAAADAAERTRILERVRWETQVLGRIGRHETILNALPPFEDEAGLCLPFEAFQGVTLSTWVENHHRKKELGGREGLKARVALFDRIAEAVEYAHRQGIVHRLLGPDAILLEDRPVAPAVRVTGFDLAKQVRSDQTVALSTVHDDRLRWAAPEVAQGFSSATPLSDEFGLGLILGFLLAGRPLFESTNDLVRNGGRATRLTELNPNVPQSLDAAVQQMLRVRPADRFGSIREARAAVRAAVEGRQPALPLEQKLDPENIPDQTQLGTDYVVLSKLGAGGLATVYAARHQLTGSTRALKVARAEPTAEEALDAEFRAMNQLDHPSIVKAIDVSASIVPGRRTLVMERVKGKPLSNVLADGPDPDAATIRHWAEDLFAALDFLDQRKVTHKDLKPDNLIVGPDGLCVIDFSLAGHPAESLFIGTALFRDPALRAWDSGADRYAAALCLFELCAGRHPFDGQAPAPGQAPRIDTDEFDAPGLAAFFAKALAPRREDRFPSAIAMRAAFLDALGVKAAAPAAQTGLAMQANASSPDLPLSATDLSSLAVDRLKLAGIQTQGDLVALSPDRLRNVSGLGKKKRKQILDFRDQLVARGVTGASAPAEPRRSLVPHLEGDPTPLSALELPAGLADLLVQTGYGTVGRLAAATASDLGAVQGVGRGRIAQIVERLQAFADRDRGAGAPATLGAFWTKATAALEGHMEKVLAETYGIRGAKRTQEQIGNDIDITQGEVSRLVTEARRRLDRGALAPIVEEVESQLAVQGNIARVAELARQLEDRYPADEGLDPVGFIRLVKWMGEPRLTTARNPERDDEDLLLGGGIPPEAIKTFVERARELAAWPPKETEAVRRALKGVLPEYDLDHIALACKLVPDLRRTDAEELFEAPVTARDAVEYVLRRERPPIPLAALRPAIDRAFGDAALLPPEGDLAKIVAEIPDFVVDGDRILAVQGKSVVPAHVAPDPAPEELRVAAKPEEVVAGELLRTAAQRRGFRLVVAPPAEHHEIAASIAQAIGGATTVSFEEELLARLEPDWAKAEQAETFAALKNRLTSTAEATYKDLLARHGQPGKRVVLADTGVLGVCNSLHLIGKLATELSSRDAGFWTVVIPGVIHNRTLLFNETTPVVNIPGMVLPVPRAIPA